MPTPSPASAITAFSAGGSARSFAPTSSPWETARIRASYIAGFWEGNPIRRRSWCARGWRSPGKIDPQPSLDSFHQPLQYRRLAFVRLAAGGGRIGDHLGGSAGGRHDDRYGEGSRIALEGAHGSAAIHDRHVQMHQDQV